VFTHRAWTSSLGFGLSVASVCRWLDDKDLTGTLPTELGNLTALTFLCVCRPHPSRLDACAFTGLWAECGGDVGCRYLFSNGLTGTLPTELGNLDALTWLCVRRPHPSRLDVCDFTGCGLSAAAMWGAGI
jgi:hypothetical protein